MPTVRSSRSTRRSSGVGIVPENVTDADLKSYANAYTLTQNLVFTADEVPVSATPQTWTEVSLEVPDVKPTDRLIIYATVDGTEKEGKARYEVDDIEVVPSSVKPVTVVFEDTFSWVNTSVDWANKLEAYKDNWAVFDGRVYAKYFCLQFGTGSYEAGITTHALTELGATPTEITIEAQLTGNAANKQSALFQNHGCRFLLSDRKRNGSHRPARRVHTQRQFGSDRRRIRGLGDQDADGLRRRSDHTDPPGLREGRQRDSAVLAQRFRITK